jgi:hypothetical protein
LCYTKKIKADPWKKSPCLNFLLTQNSWKHWINIFSFSSIQQNAFRPNDAKNERNLHTFSHIIYFTPPFRVLSTPPNLPSFHHFIGTQLRTKEREKKEELNFLSILTPIYIQYKISRSDLFSMVMEAGWGGSVRDVCARDI